MRLGGASQPARGARRPGGISRARRTGGARGADRHDHTAPAAAARALPPRPRPVEKVVVGVLGTTSDVLFYLAEDNGYFEHLRIEPVFERFDSGGRMVTSLATNQIEVGGGSPSVGLYNAIARGVNVKMVADRASGSPGYVVFVRKDLADTIRDFPDLRGRRIAIAARGTTAEIVVGRALERAGLTMADIDLVEMPYPDMVARWPPMPSILACPPSRPRRSRCSAAWPSSGAPATRSWGTSRGRRSCTRASSSSSGPTVARDFMVGYLLGARDYTDAFEKRIPDKLAQAKNTVLQRTDLRDPELLDRLENSRIDPNGQLDRVALAADYEMVPPVRGADREREPERGSRLQLRRLRGVGARPIPLARWDSTGFTSRTPAPGVRSTRVPS